MAQNPGVSLRTTQRAPRSCMSCSSRKVRCDKSVPCSTCIRRGEAEACVREMVIVRGNVTMHRDNPHTSTYEELSRENKRLRKQLDALSGSSCERPSDPERGRRHAAAHVRNVDDDPDGLERRLWRGVSSIARSTKSVVSSWMDVMVPGRACSDGLVAYDKTWNSWVHYALEYPRFQDECNAFMDAAETDSAALARSDPGWLAVYFSALAAALLLMDDDEATALLEPQGLQYHASLRNWYDAAIFCLGQADFMRIPSIRTVQAVAILGVCFNNMGDPDLGQNLWNCAIQTGQIIGLDTPFSDEAAYCLSREGQHRLWWTIVICDWLAFRNRPAGIDDMDFDVPLPELGPTDSERDGPHPVHYHLFMSRTSAVVYRFRKSIRSGPNDVDQLTRIVRAADAELAEIIDTLPAHLQPENGDSDEIRRLEVDHPWVKWQRFDLTVVLLHIRLRINRTLQTQWLESPGKYEWARSVSMSSASSVIWINYNWDQPATMRKQWALSYHIFNSAVLLLEEFRSAPGPETEKYRKELGMALELLSRVGSRNAVAHQATVVLQEAMEARGARRRIR